MSETVINLYQAKTGLSELVDRAAAGEEIVIAKAGRPLAKLVPLPTAPRRSGRSGRQGEDLRGIRCTPARVTAGCLGGQSSSKATRLLLDTQVFLWWKLDDPRLNGESREAIATADLVLVSAASAWEVAIRARLGKLDLHEDFEQGVRESGFERLPVAFSPAAETRGLPDHPVIRSTVC